MFQRLPFLIFIISCTSSSRTKDLPNQSQLPHFPDETLALEQYMEEANAENSLTRLGGGQFDSSTCNLSPELKAEIESYQPIVDKIIEASTKGEYSGRTYIDLANFVDKFGPRISGSDSLEKAIDYLEEQMRQTLLENVHSEEAVVPKWIRGNETAMLLSPREKSLSIKGLGFSVPTPDEGVVAEVVLIKSLKEMQSMAENNLEGKIVVYNSKSSEGSLHCLFGAAWAAKYGAVAALARSPDSFSLYSVHAGVQFYDEKVPKIPIAALTLEDADMIERMISRGDNVTIHLTMTNLANSEQVSRNILGDYSGHELPDEYVMLAGHSDSWDSGEGVLDDGVGPILALEVINLFQHLNLQPRRTIRSAFFTGEEAGLFGARKYTMDHKDELGSYSAALEADFGCLRASGMLFSGSTEATCIVHEIMKLYEKDTNATSLHKVRGMPTDIYLMNRGGVPGIVLNGDDGRYFWYHHTAADSLTAVNSNELDKCLAIWASTAYVIADLKEKLPRE